jgi:hypothetical protein
VAAVQMPEALPAYEGQMTPARKTVGVSWRDSDGFFDRHTADDDGTDGFAPFHGEDVVDSIAGGPLFVSEEFIPVFPELGRHCFVALVRATVWDVFGSFFLLQARNLSVSKNSAIAA